MTLSDALSDALFAAILPFGIGLCIGLAIGVLVGIVSTLQWLERRRRRQGKPVPTYTDDTNPTPGHRPWFGSEHLSRFGVLLAIVGTLAIAGSIFSVVRNTTLSSCLAEFAQVSAATNRARAEAGEIDRDADQRARGATQDTLAAFAELFAIPRDLPEADRRRLLDEYGARFARNRDTFATVEQDKVRADQIREANPLPPQPAC